MPQLIRRYSASASAFLAALALSIWAGPTLANLAGTLRNSQEATGDCDTECNYGTGEWECHGSLCEGSYCPKSKKPVKYGSGENVLSIPLLNSEGLSGLKYGLSMITDPSKLDSGLGDGWREASRIQLYQSGALVQVVAGRAPIRSFRDNFDGTYTPLYWYTTDTLTFDPGTQLFSMSNGTGNEWIFFGMAATYPGRLKELRDPDGNATTFVYGTSGTTFGALLEVQQADTANPQVLHRLVYDYYLTGNETGLASSVTYQRSISGVTTTVRKVELSYSVARLINWVKVTDGTTELDRYHFRYSFQVLSAGPTWLIGINQITHLLNPAGYERALATLGTPTAIEQASDTTLEQWAQYKFVYDGAGKVTSETIQGEGCGCSGAGGKGTWTYTHHKDIGPMTHGSLDPTAWWSVTYETDPSGRTKQVYVNKRGWKMLEVVLGTGAEKWQTYWEYEAVNGRLTAVYSPSAVASTNIAHPGLLESTNADGLVRSYEYYATTDLPNGAVEGLLRYEKIAQQVQRERAYEARSVAGVTSYHTSRVTFFAGPNLTEPRTTTYAYTWGPRHRPTQVLTTHPAISTSNNGSNVAATVSTALDAYGRATWIRDEDGFLTHRQYDALTGAVTKHIQDVNTALLACPLGWTTPSGGGLHLTDDYVVDYLGRTTRHTDAGGRITFTVFKDAAEETRVYRAWSGTSTPAMPTIVIREDHPRGYRERIGMTAPIDILSGAPTGNEAIGSVQALEREFFDNGDRVTRRDSYFNLSAYSPEVALGTQGTDFYRMAYNFDAGGRQDRVQDWTGTVRRSVYDVHDRLISEWLGTDDTPAVGEWSPANQAGTNLVKVADYEYDDNIPGKDHLRTRERHYTSTTSYLETRYTYDRTRGLRTGARGSDGVARRFSYDNLHRMTVEELYADGGTQFQIDPGEPRQRTEFGYDERGRICKSVTQEADPSTGAQPGTLRERLTTLRWFNARGILVKTRTPSGLFRKTRVDGARRAVGHFVSYDDAESSYADALTVTGDSVWEQHVLSLDGSGNELQRTSYARVSGRAKTGDLSVSWSQADSRRTFVLNWFDAANRLTFVVDYGTNNGADVTRPAVSPNPNTSDNYMVTKYEYNPAGHLFRLTNNLNRIEERAYDLLGRETAFLENWVNGVTAETELDADRRTTRVYDSAGRLSRIIAHNPKGAGQGVQQQVTQFVYGTDANQTTPAAYRNDVLAAEIHPDSDDTFTDGAPAGGKLANGPDGAYDRVEYTYDLAGRRLSMKYANGVVHAYEYDASGRPLADSVTTLPAGVDGLVQRIEWGYDELSRLNRVTSSGLPSGGTVINEVKATYDGWGNVIKVEQSHVGAVIPGTPAYEATYAEGAVGNEAKFSRVSVYVYPNGRQVHVNYGNTADDRLSRPTSYSHAASGGAPVFAQWTYQGLSRVQRVEHPAVTGGLTLNYGTTGNPAEWDRFGRILQQKWGTASNQTAHDGYAYVYDRMSNPLAKDRTQSGAPTNRDEAYTYDGLNRLKTMNRGRLSGSTIVNNTRTYTQEWTELEALGNWRSNRWDPDGAGAAGWTTQSRAHNKANEIDVDDNDANAAGASIAGAGTADWADPRFDKAGNLTAGPVPGAETTRHHYTYDAWNRLVKVHADSGGSPGVTLAEYQYDGVSQRTAKLVPAGSDWQRTDFYYNTGWQVMEERTLLVSNKETVATTPRYQYVWDVRYIDAVVLRDENKDGDGDCVDGTDQRLYYVQDANYNVTALVSAAGAIAERVQYDAYGRHSLHTAGWGAQVATLYNNAILFAGYRHDSESGLYLTRYRHYHATLGRWIQRDPIGGEDGPNLYAYVGGRPTLALDPMGLQDIKDGYVVDKAGNKIGFTEEGINCAGYATGFKCKAGPIPPGGKVPGTSLNQFMKGIGYTCHEGVLAADCKDKCKCDDCVMVYVYSYKADPDSTPENETEEHVKKMKDKHLKEGKSPFDAVDLLGETSVDYHMIKCDKSKVKGWSEVPGGSKRSEGQVQEVKKWLTKKSDYFREDQLIGQMCCCRGK